MFLVNMKLNKLSPWDWWNLAAYDTAWRLSPQTPAAAAIPGFGAANSLLDNPTMSISERKYIY